MQPLHSSTSTSGTKTFNAPQLVPSRWKRCCGAQGSLTTRGKGRGRGGKGGGGKGGGGGLAFAERQRDLISQQRLQQATAMRSRTCSETSCSPLAMTTLF